MAEFKSTINGATLYALGYVPQDGVEDFDRETDYQLIVRDAFVYDPFGTDAHLPAPIAEHVPDLPTLTQIDEWGTAHKVEGYVIDLLVDGDMSILEGAYVRDIAPQYLMRTICAGVAHYIGWHMDVIPF